jgi:tRNA U54 and U55 pseudouridine synthase Pus10
MTETPRSIPLTLPEQDLIRGLRDIADSPLKGRILAVIDELVRLGREPRCADAQADGVPCGCAQSQCETCHGAFERVDALVEQNFSTPAA